MSVWPSVLIEFASLSAPWRHFSRPSLTAQELYPWVVSNLRTPRAEQGVGIHCRKVHDVGLGRRALGNSCGSCGVRRCSASPTDGGEHPVSRGLEE